MTTETLKLLEAHCAHNAQGKSFREIARTLDIEPSTILRRARRCDEMTDHPEWEYLVQKMTERRATNESNDLTITPGEIMMALGITPDQVRDCTRSISGVLSVPGSYIMCGDMPMAVAFANSVNKVPFPKDILVFLFAMGMVIPKENKVDGKVRVFTATGNLAKVNVEMLPRDRSMIPERPIVKFENRPKELPIMALQRRDRETYNTVVVNTAYRFHELYLTRETVSGRSTYQAVRERIPHRMMLFLDMCCGEGVGMEDLEKELRLPARSAKAILLHALDVFDMVISRLKGEAPRMSEAS